jgi:hypothetical protein
MLTFRCTPATSTFASRFASSTMSMIWPGIARHTTELLPGGRNVRTGWPYSTFVPSLEGLTGFRRPSTVMPVTPNK